MFTKLADDAKRNNILDMGLTFTSMMRVFAQGSKKKIARQLLTTTSDLSAVTSADDFEKLHKTFCSWFCQEIHTAERQLRNEKTKISKPASYGQAAKVLDIVLKVYIFYCSMPSPDMASRTSQFLHGAVDTRTIKYLKHKYPGITIIASSIAQVDEQTYRTLQSMVSQDIRDRFHGDLLPVQYDDIIWQELNRDNEALA